MIKRIKLLFLDIDGVLNDHRQFKNRYSPIQPELVERLNLILEAAPDVKIVLSSAWRYSFPLKKSIQTLLAVHGATCIGRIHGKTDRDPEHWTATHPKAHDREYWSQKGLQWRRDQIIAYAQKAQCDRFVVLDDLPLDMDQLVKTDPLRGISVNNAIRAIALLEAP